MILAIHFSSDLHENETMCSKLNAYWFQYVYCHRNVILKLYRENKISKEQSDRIFDKI